MRIPSLVPLTPNPRFLSRLAIAYREDASQRGSMMLGPTSHQHHPHVIDSDDGGEGAHQPTLPPASISPLLLPALALLEQRLAQLADLLDGPSFRDIWRAGGVGVRGEGQQGGEAVLLSPLTLLLSSKPCPLSRAVAVPVNRFMFNHVATEARFSQAGAMQVTQGEGDLACRTGVKRGVACLVGKEDALESRGGRQVTTRHSYL